MASVVCTYDNPETMRRECWSNGKLLAFYTAQLLMTRGFSGDSKIFFFGANIGPWRAGQLIGDKCAMESAQ